MRKVRIVRKQVNFVSALLRLGNVFVVMARIYQHRIGEANRDYMTKARHDKLVEDTELSRIRQAKLTNDVVLVDLKIEEKRRELGLDAPAMPKAKSWQ